MTCPDMYVPRVISLMQAGSRIKFQLINWLSNSVDTTDFKIYILIGLFTKWKNDCNNLNIRWMKVNFNWNTVVHLFYRIIWNGQRNNHKCYGRVLNLKPLLNWPDCIPMVINFILILYTLWHKMTCPDMYGALITQSRWETYCAQPWFFTESHITSTKYKSSKSDQINQRTRYSKGSKINRRRCKIMQDDTFLC